MNIAFNSISKENIGLILLALINRTTGNLSLDMQEFLAVNRMAFDSHCIDDMALFDKSKDIPAAIDILKSHGKKIILSAYPHVR